MCRVYTRGGVRSIHTLLVVVVSVGGVDAQSHRGGAKAIHAAFHCATTVPIEYERGTLPPTRSGIGNAAAAGRRPCRSDRIVAEATTTRTRARRVRACSTRSHGTGHGRRRTPPRSGSPGTRLVSRLSIRQTHITRRSGEGVPEDLSEPTCTHARTHARTRRAADTVRVVRLFSERPGSHSAPTRHSPARVHAVLARPDLCVCV